MYLLKAISHVIAGKLVQKYGAESHHCNGMQNIHNGHDGFAERILLLMRAVLGEWFCGGESLLFGEWFCRGEQCWESGSVEESSVGRVVLRRRAVFGEWFCGEQGCGRVVLWRAVLLGEGCSLEKQGTVGESRS